MLRINSLTSYISTWLAKTRVYLYIHYIAVLL